jgi:hypothetical protein
MTKCEFCRAAALFARALYPYPLSRSAARRQRAHRAIGV